MKKALIKDDKIIQISEIEFDVHPDFIWVECPDDCNTSWVYKDGVCQPVIVSLEQLKTEKKAENAAKRYAKETSGVVYDGHLFFTEREDVNIMNATMEKIRRCLVSVISWKCGDGSYIDLTADNILNIEIAILTHIQTSFATEKAYNEAIDSSNTIEELNNINIVY